MSQEAKALLEQFWDLKIPIDPEFFAKQVGLTVERKDLGLQSGYFDSDKRLIVVNNQEVEERQRFTIAHELGHFCLNHGSSYRDTATPGWFRKVNSTHETEANKFAAELLMPAIAVKILIDVRKIRDAVELRQAFGVSSQALHWRLKSLGYFI